MSKECDIQVSTLVSGNTQEKVLPKLATARKENLIYLASITSLCNVVIDGEILQISPCPDNCVFRAYLQ